MHTVVETCGLARWEYLAETAAVTDLFYFDIKMINSAKHKDFCGEGNATIFDNARRLVESGAQIVFRTPLIPEFSDFAEDIHNLGAFILSLPGRQSLELMPYHGAGKAKYDALGIDYSLPDVQSSIETTRCKRELADMGIQVTVSPVSL